MKATYVDHMGSDLTVVNSARVSFAKVAEEFTDKDTKLIRYLAQHQHWTPFAHPQITLHMKAPIFVRTQCFKHKVGFTENEVSRRYVDDEPTFYVPDAWRKRADNKKQGSSEEVITHIDFEPVWGFRDKSNYPASLAYEEAIGECVLLYKTMIDSGVAPEQARMVLPQSMLTEWYWTGSLAAYARFVKQRTDPHAQQEIQEMARMVGAIIQPLFPVSWEALTS